MAEDAASKTEEPTPKKLEDARRKGDVAKSLDIPQLASLAAAFGVLAGARTGTLEMISPGMRREVVDGVDKIRGAYTAGNVATLLDLPFALVFVGMLFLLSPPIAVVASTVITLVLLGSLASSASLASRMKDLAVAGGRRGGLIASAIVAADTIRAFNLGGFVRQAWETEDARQRRLATVIGLRQGLLQSATQTGQALMAVAVMALGAVLVVKGELNIGALIGCNILAGKALGPIVSFAKLAEAFAKAGHAGAMIGEFARLPMERLQGSKLAHYAGALEFRDLAFAYPNAKGPLFESLTLRLEPGSLLVASGGNGTGKTTLARLLLGLVEPTRGQIFIDGVDLAQVLPEWWRRQVIYLPQEPRFLNGTLAENIRAVNPDLDDEALSALIDQAGLRDFVSRSAAGLASEITGHGDNLALGIRRRLALARALAHDGMLAVIDEPGEGLDKEGVARVNAVLMDLARRGRTIVVLTHDPSTIRGARWVVDLNAKPVPRVQAGDTP
ncbi:MAG: ATP-binding cassette domain-containing protein [Magnetospirillum sp. WYHS-4]